MAVFDLFGGKREVVVIKQNLLNECSLCKNVGPANLVTFTDTNQNGILCVKCTKKMKIKMQSKDFIVYSSPNSFSTCIICGEVSGKISRGIFLPDMKEIVGLCPDCLKKVNIVRENKDFLDDWKH